MKNILLSLLLLASAAHAAEVPSVHVQLHTGTLREECTATLSGVRGERPVRTVSRSADLVTGLRVTRGETVQVAVRCDKGEATFQFTAREDTLMEFSNAFAGWDTYVGKVPGLRVLR